MSDELLSNSGSAVPVSAERKVISRKRNVGNNKPVLSTSQTHSHDNKPLLDSLNNQDNILHHDDDAFGVPLKKCEW